MTKKITAPPKPRLRKKSPSCPVHKDEMNFDEDYNVWRCPDSTCKVVGRPKTETDAGDVVLGRGPVIVRVVRNPAGEERVLLVSANNVGLDVTAQIDTEQFGRLAIEYAKKESANLYLPFTPGTVIQEEQMT